jgi:hypothetical protein
LERLHIHKGRLYALYSAHKNRERAEAALENYYADGDVSDACGPLIVVRKGRAGVYLLA